jgi:hypothetical protein
MKVMNKYHAVRWPVLVSFLAGGLLVAGVACWGCSSNSTVLNPPSFTFTSIGGPSPQLTLEKLVADYQVDQTAADTVYKGKRFMFTGVKVEKMSRMGEPFDPDVHFLSLAGQVKCRPEYRAYHNNIRTNFIIDLSGVVYGMINGIIIIDYDWFKVVDPIVTGTLPPISEY